MSKGLLDGGSAILQKGIVHLGDKVVFVGTSKLPFGHEPLQLNKVGGLLEISLTLQGLVQCLLQNGKISGILLDSHMTDTVLEGKSPVRIREMLDRALLLKRFV